MERKAHVRAAIVDGMDVVTLREETERVPFDVDDEPPGRTQLGKRSGADETFGRRGSSHVCSVDLKKEEGADPPRICPFGTLQAPAASGPCVLCRKPTFAQSSRLIRPLSGGSWPCFTQIGRLLTSPR
jgi:hypothetical protein